MPAQLIEHVDVVVEQCHVSTHAKGDVDSVLNRRPSRR